MNQAEIVNFLAEGLELLGLQLDHQSEAISRLALYFHELKKWNNKINLVARTMDDRLILENHFLDSLTLLLFMDPENLKKEAILDIGTGAGFPGLVLKAVQPVLSVVLIEPRRNRCFFLKHVARAMKIGDVETLNERIEENKEMQKLSGRKYSFITSRAFTDSTRFVRLVAPYLAPGGRIVSMKGPGAEKELEKLNNKGLPETFYVADTKKLQLPFSKAKRTLIFIRCRDEESV